MASSSASTIEYYKNITQSVGITEGLHPGTGGPNQKALAKYFVTSISCLNTLMNQKDLSSDARTQYQTALKAAQNDLRKVLENDQTEDFYADRLKKFQDIRAKAKEEWYDQFPCMKKIKKLKLEGKEPTEEDLKELMAEAEKLKNLMSSNNLPDIAASLGKKAKASLDDKS